MKALATSRRLLGMIAALMAVAILAAACGSDDEGAEDGTDPAAAGSDEAGSSGDEDTAMEESDAEAAMAEESTGVDFPRDIATAAGTVTIDAEPTSIVSLSPTATEMLFALGAGDLVSAVDLYSNYPAEAPKGTLDGFVPDLEAILASDPDLVVASGLPEDVTAGLTDSGVAVLLQPAAGSFDDTYDQIAQLGEATGQIDEAAALNAEIRAGIEEVLAALPQSDEPVRVFHEIDDSFYTATSNSFIGQVYATMGFENIADPLDDGSGFPLVDGESVIAADPSLIVFTDQAAYTKDEIMARPGWNGVAAVKAGNVVQVDADIASRWGPRIVEFMRSIADVVAVNAWSVSPLGRSRHRPSGPSVCRPCRSRWGWGC